MKTISKSAALTVVTLGVATLGGALLFRPATLGKQPDGSYIVSSGQRVLGGAIAFKGRPADIAWRPGGDVAAVLNKSEILLVNANGLVAGTPAIKLGADAGFHGLHWTPDGSRLIATTEKGQLQTFDWDGKGLVAGATIDLKTDPKDRNPVPGGFDISKDGKTLWVACINRNAVVKVDLVANKRVDEIKVQTMPYEAKFAEDERTLIVSNWGGYLPKPGDKTMKSDDVDVVVNAESSTKSGCVSIIDLATRQESTLQVGLHPCAIDVQGGLAYVANAMSDSVSELNVAQRKVVRTFPIRYNGLKVVGSLPNALEAVGNKLYVCNAGDNALCQIDLKTGKPEGWRPVGYFPIGLAIEPGSNRIFVVNSKGNGSVQNTSQGKKGNAHDFQGSVSVVDLTSNLTFDTKTVAENNSWGQGPLGLKPNLKVYNGAIKHVVYIIKENRTYDEIYGDLPQGNGDPSLCSLGEKVMPNHRKIAQEFTLFDNGYVSGTNSAEGHNWTTQGYANDYLERFYVGYSRTYPDDGRDAMAINASGCLWNAAEKKKKSIRIYGEFMNADKNHWQPREPKDWFEVWEMRKAGRQDLIPVAVPDMESVKKYAHPRYHYWPLWMSDQMRADMFIEEYAEFSKANKVPNLMILSLPCDHTEGVNPKYPTPRAMQADNDLALGRIVEAISNSPQWKETCIFVIEDDAQSGPDHVDGHRTNYLAISPYSRRRAVDSTLYTTVTMVKTIEAMLGLEPLSKFDTLAKPMDGCFTDKPDFTPYKAVPNNIPLDEPNPGRKSAPTPEEAYWIAKTASLDWSHVDAPDPYWLNRINWWANYRGSRPYPERPGERPGQFAEDDD